MTTATESAALIAYLNETVKDARRYQGATLHQGVFVTIGEAHIGAIVTALANLARVEAERVETQAAALEDIAEYKQRAEAAESALSTAHAAGFAEGVEAAAKYHDECAAEFPGSIFSGEARQHAKRIRTLTPASKPAGSEQP